MTRLLDLLGSHPRCASGSYDAYLCPQLGQHSGDLNRRGRKGTAFDRASNWAKQVIPKRG